jgi:hypothetical protein
MRACQEIIMGTQIQTTYPYRSIKSKLYYSESDRAWNMMRFRKEMYSDFPEMNMKEGQLKSELMFFYTVEHLKQVLELMEKEGLKLPIMMLRFFKEK